MAWGEVKNITENLKIDFRPFFLILIWRNREGRLGLFPLRLESVEKFTADTLYVNTVAHSIYNHHQWTCNNILLSSHFWQRLRHLGITDLIMRNRQDRTLTKLYQRLGRRQWRNHDKFLDPYLPKPPSTLFTKYRFSHCLRKAPRGRTIEN